MIKHRVAKQNKATNALGRKAYLLVTLQPLITSFESLHDQYSSDEDFAAIWDKYMRHEPVGGFSISKGYLFKGHQLCIHKTYLREQLVRELHSGGLAAHTGRDKTLILVEDRFFWPHMRRDVKKFVQRCAVCSVPKELLRNMAIYLAANS